MRCFDASSWTSSRWISYDGSAYRLYHAGDGGSTWSAPLLPIVDDAGCLRFGGKVRLEQALARAWHPLSRPFARHPRVHVVDATESVCAGNVCWEEPPSELDENVEETIGAQADEHGATTFQFAPPVRLPPCVDAALLATGSATTLDDVAATCGVSRVTALNYLGKGLAKCPNRACPRRGARAARRDALRSATETLRFHGRIAVRFGDDASKVGMRRGRTLGAAPSRAPLPSGTRRPRVTKNDE